MLHRRVFQIALFAAFFSGVVGCASTTDTRRMGSEPPAPENVRVHPAAYGTDGFTFNKPMDVHPSGGGEFFFKHCSLINNRSFYSRTDYGCE